MMRALLRGKIVKMTHEKGGFTDEVVPLVGTDEFGNRYYEDFTAHGKNQRRWVEYADTGKTFPTIVKKMAPGWHGWMHYMYDDPPRQDNYVNPAYRSHRTSVFKVDHPELSYKNGGHLMNDDREEILSAA